MYAGEVSTRFIRRVVGVCFACCLIACSHRPLSPHHPNSDSDGGSADASSDGDVLKDARSGDADATVGIDTVIEGGYGDGPASDQNLADSAGDVPSGDGDGSARRYHAIGVAAGDGHACALLDDHHVKCWGSNAYGQLGYGDALERGATPAEMGDALPVIELGSGRKATKVATGGYATCAIMDDGSLKCWGKGGLNGQVPPKNIGDRPGEMGDNLPSLDFGGRKATNVAIADLAACAAMDDDTIWCWSPGTRTMMVGLPIAPVRALSATFGHVFALYEDGTVSPDLQGATSPVLTSGHKMLAISGATQAPPCALLDDGTILCSSSGVNLIRPSGTVTALGIEQFSESVCGLFADGTVRCPADGNCQPGTYWCDPNGTTALGESATAITNNGYQFMCALLAKGDVKCWGSFLGGQTPPAWLGSGVSLLSTTNGMPNYGPWNAVDLGTHL